MKQTIESVKQQFEALSAKLDPQSAQMLKDRDYATQLGDCIAKTYVMLNSGMCEELEVCHTCAQQRDYLREALETFEDVAQSGQVDAVFESFYFSFVEQLGTIRANIDKALAHL